MPSDTNHKLFTNEWEGLVITLCTSTGGAGNVLLEPLPSFRNYYAQDINTCVFLFGLLVCRGLSGRSPDVYK